jgi:hypothetical protein
MPAARRSGDPPAGAAPERSAPVIAAALAAGLAAGLSAATLVAGGGSGSSVAELPGVPAVHLLAHGRVLVLRPHRLQVAVDGRVRREIPVAQPLDLAQLPDVVNDPAFASTPAPGVVRLGAVLVQRPDTTLEAGDDGGHLRLELDDSGGAGPGRITGTRAALRLRAATVVTGLTSGTASVSGVAAGLRYLHQSDVWLDDVTLDGLGGTGRTGVPALRTDGGGRIRLHAVRVLGQGRGIAVEDAVGAEITEFTANGLGGDALVVSGGSGARISGVRVEGLAAGGVRLHQTLGAGLADVRVRTSGVALGVEGGDGVVVRGGELQGGKAAVRAVDGHAVVLDDVTTTGAVRGATVAGGAGPSGSGPVSRWRPVEGAGAVTLLVVSG